VLLREWFQPPRHLLGIFLGVTFVLAVALGWLGYRLFEQDRQLEHPQIQQRLNHPADLIGARLLHELSSAQERLSGLLALSDSRLAAQAPAQAEALGSDGALVVISQRGFDCFPEGRLIAHCQDEKGELHRILTILPSPPHRHRLTCGQCEGRSLR
jgi:hypothetical protein